MNNKDGEGETSMNVEKISDAVRKKTRGMER